MSKNAWRFMTAYIFVAITIIVLFFTCSGCKTVHRAVTKKSEHVDSVAAINKTLLQVNKTDSTISEMSQDEFQRLIIELNDGGTISNEGNTESYGDSIFNYDSLNTAYRASFLRLTNIKFPQHTKLTFEKGQRTQQSFSNKKTNDSGYATDHSTIAVKKDIAIKDKNLEAKGGIPFGFVAIVIFVVIMIAYCDLRFFKK